MATGRSRNLAPWLILAALTPLGCTQPNPFTSRQTMVGSLKASVSQLEFENEKLRKEKREPMIPHKPRLYNLCSRPAYLRP